MAQRIVTIKHPSLDRPKDYRTSASTFGELKHDTGLDFSGKNCIVRETRASLTNDYDSLPAGNFNLYVHQEKSKAGLK